MNKSDGLVLFGICTGASVAVTLMILVANGVISNPFP